MKPDESLYHRENHGGLGVPRFHAEMPRGTPQRLAVECVRMSGAQHSEAALAERLLVLMGKRREIQHPVSHVPGSETPESANANKDLDEAA